MRVRPAALAPALITLMLVGAGCGGGSDEAASPTPVPSTAETPPANVGGTTAGGGDAAATPAVDTGVSTKDSLTEQIAKNPDLRTLWTALRAAGLTSLLDGGNYTVFAPNNDAFTKLGTQLDGLIQPSGKAQLTNILKFHIVKGRVRASQLRDGKLLTTIQGDRLRVSTRGDEVMVGNSLGKSLILTPNAKASNGVIHTVDTVLRPKTGG